MDLLEELGVLAMLTPVPRGGVSHVCLPSTLVGMMLRDYPREFRLRFGADTAVLKLQATSWTTMHSISQAARAQRPMTGCRNSLPCSTGVPSQTRLLQ